MSFSKLFENKIKSIKLCEYLEDIVRKMTALKLENHDAKNKILERTKEIRRIEEALAELGIPYDAYQDLKFDEEDYGEWTGNYQEEK